MSVAQWQYQPACPGVWVRRRWWGDDGGRYDQDSLMELVDRGNGFLEIASNHGSFYPLDNGGVSVSMWYGPIPKCPVERLTRAEHEQFK